LKSAVANTALSAAPWARSTPSYVIVGHLDRRPSDMTFASVCWRGEGVRSVATAFGDRSMPYMVSFDAIWSEQADDAANIDWAREAWGARRRYGSGRMYLNFPGHGEDDDLVRSARGGDVYAHLAKVKRVYGPENLFRMNQNVRHT
jgi:hypothetical protein